MLIALHLKAPPSSLMLNMMTLLMPLTMIFLLLAHLHLHQPLLQLSKSNTHILLPNHVMQMALLCLQALHLCPMMLHQRTGHLMRMRCNPELQTLSIVK